MTNEVGQGLTAALREGAWTAPIPRTVGGQARFLARQFSGSKAARARAVAAILGVAPRTAERYMDNKIKKPHADVAARLERAVNDRWQPRNVAGARKAAADTKGLMIEIDARIGYRGAPGTTDEDRVRHLTVALPPYWAGKLLDSQAAGANEDDLREVAAAALREVYFQDDGQRAHGLEEVRLTDVQNVEFGL
ncbi:telomere-protecting terminal protein Tpg [Streptomyces sp. NPDC001633]|uniref:telomere-protecting terminal protein Tpg n=1 Tax=Streptomyces sp. NPDC001633 TaxID=3364595 RepID=UPI00368E2D61